MILPVAIPAQASQFARARAVHSACLAGGSAITGSELVEILHAAGLVDLAEHLFSTQRLMTYKADLCDGYSSDSDNVTDNNTNLTPPV